MEYWSDLVAALGNLVWGPYMLVILSGLGVWLTFRTGFFPLRRFFDIVHETVGSLFGGKKRDKSPGAISPFQAVSTALAGTLGTGNIAGVATAIVAGGPGAIFWMWVSAFFSMMTKYAEVALAIRYRERDGDGAYRGGPMYYIEKGVGAPWLAGIFSIFCVLASFGIGNATQVNAVAQGLSEAFGAPAALTGTVTAALVFLVIIGGIRRVGSIAQVLVPAMALLYMGGGCFVLAQNAGAIPGALALIFRCAFDPRAALGGAAGYTVLLGVRYGVSRGIFSNEAGLGSAPIAHASADARGPVEQGMWGIFEVFVDTILMCGFSGLIILSSGDLWRSGLDGAALTGAAFTRVLGPMGGWIVSVSMVFFAFSSILGWAYYGETALGWLTRGSRGWLTAYRLLYVAVTALAASADLGLVWGAADVLNGLMSIPNLLAVTVLSGEVVAMTKGWKRH